MADVALSEPASSSPPAPGVGLARARIGVVGVITAILALAADEVFGTTYLPLLVAAALPPLVAVAAVRTSWWWRAAALTAAVVAGVGTVVWIAGGTPGDVATGFGSGLQRLLSTEWPSPEQPDLLATVAAALAVTAAVGATLARSPRWHLAPLLPPLVCWVGITALSAPAGAQLQWLLPLGALAMLFATLRPGAELAERWALLRGERQLVPVLALSAMAAAALALPLSFGPRADPRRTDPPERSAALLDPVEATLALQELDPTIALYGIEMLDGDAPSRWRTAALRDYDGQRWLPDLAVRPIGQRLGTTDRDAVAAEVRVLDRTVELVPLPGEPLRVAAPIQTDSDRTLVRLTERPDRDAPFVVEAAPEPDRDDVPPGVIGTREVDESVSALQSLAEQLAGDGSVLDQLDQLARVMRNDYLLDPGAPGGGLQRALLDRFLRDTRRGNEEQFVSGFVLLAQALGVDARVATGFVASPDAGDPDGGAFTLDSDEAQVWAEVRLVDDGWITFDPVPEEESAAEEPDPPRTQVQAPAAAQPPAEPPSQPRADPGEQEQSETEGSSSALGTVVWAVVRATLVIVAVITPFLVAAGLVLGAKLVRRRRRLGAPDATERIRGAWSVATDDLVDAGLAIGTASTDGEIAESGAPYASGARPELHRLARLSGAATFGRPARPDLAADDALTCLELIESSIVEDRTPLQRARWRLSLRSLRPSTRSPV